MGNKKINNQIKLGVKVASVGAIDECDYCKLKFKEGVCCFPDNNENPLNLCHRCLWTHYKPR